MNSQNQHDASPAPAQAEDPQPITQNREVIGSPDAVELRGGFPLVYRCVMALIFIVLLVVGVSAYRSGLGTFARPGSGLWIAVATCIALAAWPVAFFIKQEYEVFNWNRIHRVGFMLLGLIAFATLLPWAGFFIASCTALIIITRFSAAETWKNTIVLAFLTTALIYGIFGYFFQVGFPLLPSFLTEVN